VKYGFLYGVIALALVSCSSESTSWTSKAFHNTTAHYNGYFYALEEITKIERTILKNHQDDYNRILLLFPRLDSALAKSYDKEIQEAIKMASLSIQRHPNSKWVPDAYLLVGKARLYSFDWGNAIQTFKYVNNPKISKHPDTRHQALVQLIRTFTEHGEYNNAEAVFGYLEKEKLSKSNRKDFLLAKANYYQVRNDLDNLVRNLTEAAPLLTRKDRAGRVYFILGQVYQALGFEAEAYNFYRQCISTHPEYEVDFYARLYMAQVAEISKSKNLAAARKSFKKLLKDSKNREFTDKIHYEMGVFEEKQGNVTEALAEYNLAVRKGSNTLLDGEAYLRMGELYYDTLRNFEMAQAYYDSAVNALSKEHANYAAIKLRQEVLDEFVKNLNTITWQDSLLALSTLDTAALYAEVERFVKARELQENAKVKKKKSRVTISQVTTTSATDVPLQATAWYFGNASAVALGQSEFARQWGNIPLEDNWRRSSRAALLSTRVEIPVTDAGNVPSEIKTPEVKRDPVKEAYDNLYAQVPKTPEQVREAHTKIEEAYFALGDIYYFKLDEKNNALNSFETLLSRFPETTHRPEVLYKLYLIYKDTDPARAEQYASELIQKYPDTHVAKILVNPSYQQESNALVEKQKVKYRAAYESFTQAHYVDAERLLDEALSLGETDFVPQLLLVKAMISGKTEPIAKYQLTLDELIKKYPDTDAAAYAKQLLEASRQFELRKEKEKGVNYIRSFEAPHYFIMVYSRAEKLEETATKTLEEFNRRHFRDLNLSVSNLILSETMAMTMVSDLPRVSAALEYHKLFTEKLSELTGLANRKFDNFVITKDNFNIFYRTKGLDEYLRFFEKNYRAENP
jgi:TolA-binding protein